MTSDRSGFSLATVLSRVADFVRRAPLEQADALRRDASHAIRTLRKRPASTATVVLSLAIGIGLNTALFAVINGVLWQSLPFLESDRLVRIVEVDATSPERTSRLTQGDFVDLREQSRGFAAVAAGAYSAQTIVDPGEPEQLAGMMVAEGFFEVLGARPALGRTFTTADYAAFGSIAFDQLGAIATRLEENAKGRPLTAGVIVISHSLWQRRFLGRPNVIGQKLRLESGVLVEIVGVMGPESSAIAPALSAPPEWWLPQTPRRDLRRGRTLDVIARLAPGRSLDQAQAELSVYSSLGRSFRAVRLLDTIVKDVRGQLRFLFGAVLCVLLVTCVNVVHLFLANAAGRRVELATRVALGATRAVLVRQTLTESAVLAAVGGVGGLLLATWGLPFLLSIAPSGVPRLNEIRLDWWTIGYAVSASIGVALLCRLTASALRRSSCQRQPATA